MFAIDNGLPTMPNYPLVNEGEIRILVDAFAVVVKS